MPNLKSQVDHMSYLFAMENGNEHQNEDQLEPMPLMIYLREKTNKLAQKKVCIKQ